MFCKMTSTTNVGFIKDTKQSFRVLSTTTTVEVQSTKKNSKNFVFCNLYSTRKGLTEIFFDTDSHAAGVASFNFKKFHHRYAHHVYYSNLLRNIIIHEL